jgi:hypothetical protein
MQHHHSNRKQIGYVYAYYKSMQNRLAMSALTSSSLTQEIAAVAARRLADP